MEEESKNSSATESKTLDILERAQLLIVRVCDEGPDYYQRDIGKLKEFFVNQLNEKDKEDIKEEIIKKLVECICLINQKGAIYATVVALIEQKIPGFAENIIDKVLNRLQETLDEGQLIIPKFALIFLGEIMNIGIINNFTFITLLYDLISEAEKNSNQSFDYYLYIVISILPYLSSTLLDKSALEFKSLMENIKSIMIKRNSRHFTLLFAYKDANSIDFLEELWNEIAVLIDDEELKISGLVKPYEIFSSELKGLKQIKKNKKLFFHSKNLDKCSLKTLPYIKFFNMETINNYDNAMSKLDRLLIYDDLKDLVRKILFQNLIFYKSTMNYYPILIEVVFNLLVSLPDSPLNTLIYPSILLMLAKDTSNCKKNIEFIKTSFKYFYDNADLIDPQALFKVASVLGIYLSNTYKSNEMRINIESYENPSNSLKMNFFIRQILWNLKSLLSKKIEDEEWIEQFKDFLLENEAFNLNHLKADSENYTDAEIILDKFNTKVDDEEMFEFIDNSSSNSLLSSSFTIR